MFRRILAAAVLVVIAAVLLLAAWPQLIGLQLQAGVAQVVSLRGLTVLIAAALVILFTLISLISPRTRRFTGTLGVLLLAFSVLTVLVLSTRGFGNPSMQKKADADITVLSWNTLGDAPGADEIAALALKVDADVVVLPETSVETADIVKAIMTDAGHGMQQLHLSLDEISKARTTSVLISTAMGTYVLDDSAGTTEVLPSVIAVPTDGTGPTIVAAHPISPVPGEMAHWRNGLDWLADRCTGKNIILAGDLNSTLDHYTGLGVDGGDLGRCHDAAKATGNAAVGTWPTSFPPLLGAPIDHVMATPDWQLIGFRVIQTEDGAGSDHRPVVAQLRPAG
jgi:endonuclease/exonuclease/phosphatase (EEP) superfamily protein YafD